MLAPLRRPAPGFADLATGAAFEQVAWGLFDHVGVDHYREARTKDRYVEMLQPSLATGKPVIVTEFGEAHLPGRQSLCALGSASPTANGRGSTHVGGHRAFRAGPPEGDV